MGNDPPSLVSTTAHSSFSATTTTTTTTNNTTSSSSVLTQRDRIRQINENTKLLRQELQIEYRESREVLAPSKIETLKDLQQRSAAFSRKIELEKRRLVKYEQTLEHKHLVLQQHREGAGSVDEKKDSAAANKRRMSGFENRLENCLVKKNEIESENKQLVAKVELVRRDRVVRVDIPIPSIVILVLQ